MIRSAKSWCSPISSPARSAVYAIADLEPKLFSFSNPSGACATCSGLGVQQFFDPTRVVHHPNLSLAGGAIRGWDRRSAYYFALMQSLAKHYKFDVEEQWQDLPAKVKKIVLYGSGEEKIDFKYVNAQGGTPASVRTSGKA